MLTLSVKILTRKAAREHSPQITASGNAIFISHERSVIVDGSKLSFPKIIFSVIS